MFPVLLFYLVGKTPRGHLKTILDIIIQMNGGDKRDAKLIFQYFPAISWYNRSLSLIKTCPEMASHNGCLCFHHCLYNPDIFLCSS